MAADSYAGQNGNSATSVLNNQENKAPADRAGYDPTSFTGQPGAAARGLGYPRSDGTATAVSTVR